MTNAYTLDTTVLDSAPAHWARVPIWSVVRRLDIKGRPDAQRLSVYRDYGVVPTNSRDDNFNKPGEDLTAYRFVSPGQLVLNKMKTWQGSLAVSEYEGIVSPAYFVCSLASVVYPRFAHYLLRSDPYIGFYRALSKGIRPNQWDLPFEDFRLLPILLPPLGEQRRIAGYLDYQTATHAKLVQSLGRHKDLLLQTRESSLSAVWGADISRRRRLGYFALLVTSGSRSWSEHVRDEGEIFFRSANLRRDNISPNLKSVVRVDVPAAAAAEARRARIRPGDVLVGITGANAGWVTLADDSLAGGYVSQHVCLIRASRQIVPRWLAYALSSPQVQESLVASQYGGTKTQLSLPDIRNVAIPDQSVDSQHSMAQRITVELEAIELQKSIRDRQEALLDERLRSLVTAAVTGQMDVTTARGIAA